MRTPSKKPRGDSKLDRLPEDQKEQLCAWLTVENLTYREARTRCAEQFCCFTTEHALSQFFRSVALPWKYAQAKGEADAFAQLMEGNFDAASIKVAKQLAFEAMTSPQPNIEAAKSLLKMVGDSAKVDLARERLSLDARKVKLLEAKAAQADAAEGVTRDPTLTPELREQKLKEIFGLK